MTSAHDFTARTIDGQDKKLSDYAGKALLVVNVASRCGLTPQYEGLEKLYRAEHDQGLEILGFPCNQFGKQEPGTEEEIQSFCSTRYDVTFPMFAKVEVNGADAHPLYAWLRAETDGTDIQWNFEKFVIGKDGSVIARFAPTTKPEAHEIREAIARALG